MSELFREEAQAFHAVGYVELMAPYRREFVEELKDTIPVEHRSWDGQCKVWRISSEWWTVARTIVERHYELME